MKERKSKCPFLSHHFCHPSPRATFTFHIFVFFLPLLLNLFSQFVCLDECVCVFGLFFYFTLHRFCIIFQGRRQSAAGVAYISICPTGDAARSEREGQNSWSWPFVQPTRWVSVCLSRRPEEKLLPQFCTVRLPIKLHSRCHYFLVYSQNGH